MSGPPRALPPAIHHESSRAPRRTASAAIVVAALSVVAAALATWADMAAGPGPRPEPFDWAVWSSTVPGVALAAAGGVLALRLPRHLMTWLLIGGGAVACANGLAAAYAVLSLTGHGGTLPLTPVAVYAAARLGPLLNLVPPLVLLFFPDGRLPSPRWRWAASLSLGSIGLAILVFLTFPWRIESTARTWPGIDLPLPPIPDDIWRAAMAVAPVLLVPSLLVPVAAFAWRFRGSSGVRRAQLRWMLLAALLNGVLTLIPMLVRGLPQDLAFVASLVAIAAAVLVAVGRYRLYDIDPVLNWTLLYGGLAVAVVVIDVPVFVGLGALIDEPVAAVLAAAVVAVVYAPLRTRARRWVNRVLAGGSEPYDVVSVLARRLEDSVGPDELLLEVARAVSASFRSPYVRVELDRADGQTVVVEHGTPRDGMLVLPFAYREIPIGRLALAPRRGAPLAEADQRLLADVVRQAAAAVRATALTEELQHSRERLVTGVAEERRRLRRDLHDGLGPTLAAAALKVEAARNLAVRDVGAARDALDQVRRDLATVIGDVRRLVHDLRPPALDQFGLAGALRQEGARFRAGGLAVRVEALGDMDGLPAAAEVAAYRIVCEALVNVARHAGAATCEVRLTASGDELEVEVVDDGRGIRPGALVGVGLVGMRERAEELGGRCAVSTPEGGGTRVHAVLPARTGASL
ncbi:sensor histidine kinase [Microtetraspora sp. AC03309]|uniref:sensor histidine kinase n=1 Tax=Microtetraspora sp. AC03309 TaxID=2779376 RepID=UPI001E4D7048|nr:sensor histidine kinase [Microtetraspora sp. AC03309]